LRRGSVRSEGSQTWNVWISRNLNRALEARKEVSERASSALI